MAYDPENDEVWEIIFRPQITRPKLASDERVPTFRRLVSAYAAALRGKQAPASRRSGGPSSALRRVIVKSRVVKMGASNSRAVFKAHLSYIERDGVDKGEEKGRLYGRDASFARDDFGTKLEGEPHHFRLIISPEDAHQLDLKEYTRDLMLHMEQAIGRKMNWAAVNHYNTDHPHVHVVVRGLDEDGHPLHIPRRYLYHSLRFEAQELATNELGPRTQKELDRTLDQEVTKERQTSLDRSLQRIADDKGVVKLNTYPKRPKARLHHQRLVGRLETLEQLGLAHRTGGKTWQLKDKWSQKLKDLGMRNDIIKQMHHHLYGKVNHYQIYNGPEEIKKPIEGKVVVKGLADELYDRPYVVIATPDGMAHWVKLKDVSQLESIKSQQIISVEAKRQSWIKPIDKTIAKVAEKSGGIYQVEVHKALIEKGAVPKISLEFVHRRLQRLQRSNIIEQTSPNQWRIPSSFLDHLREKDQKAPLKPSVHIKQKSNLSLEAQQSFKGPTWLDKQALADNSRAHFGFGVELDCAVKKRAEVLRSMGIDPADPLKIKKLEQLEHKLSAQKEAMNKEARIRQSIKALDDFIEQEKKISGYGYVKPSAQRKVCGEVIKQKIETGQQMALIRDDRNMEFALVPWRSEYERLRKSKRVELSIQNGRVLIRDMERGLSR